MSRSDIVRTSVVGLVAVIVIVLLSLLVARAGQSIDLAFAIKRVNNKQAVVQAQILKKAEAQALWEYNVVAAIPEMPAARTGIDAARHTQIALSAENMSKKFGSQGWELVTAYLETETAFPNFGDEKYVTGLKSNIRPARLVMIFKRRVQK
jgi:hypothetical protein